MVADQAGSIRSRLLELVKTWRESALFEFENANGQRAQTLDQCADEVDEVLALPSPRMIEQQKDDVTRSAEPVTTPSSVSTRPPAQKA